MSVRVTPDALALMRRSLELAKADPADVGVRLRVAGGSVRPRFVAEPVDGDTTVEVDGLRVYVSAEIVERFGDVEVAVSAEHERLIVQPVSP